MAEALSVRWRLFTLSEEIFIQPLELNGTADTNSNIVLYHPSSKLLAIQQNHAL